MSWLGGVFAYDLEYVFEVCPLAGQPIFMITQRLLHWACSPDVNTRESEARAATLLGGRSNPLVSFPAGMPKSVLSMLGQPSYTTKDKETHRPTAA